MQTRELMELMSDAELVLYIRQCARRRSKNKEDQEDSRQEAWLALSCAPAGYSTEAYKSIAYKSIFWNWWKVHKQTLVSNKIKQLSDTRLIHDGMNHQELYEYIRHYGQATYSSEGKQRKRKLRFFLKKKRGDDAS